MITIGLRSEPTVVTFAIFDTKENKVLNVEEIRIPAAFDVPDALKFLRMNLLDVLREYGVEKAGIRVTEGNARNLSVARVQIEGVIQEAFASSELKAYYIGRISSISRRLGIDSARFKPLVDGKDDLGVEGWKGMAKDGREAILCAMGAANA